MDTGVESTGISAAPVNALFLPANPSGYERRRRVACECRAVDVVGGVEDEEKREEGSVERG